MKPTRLSRIQNRLASLMVLAVAVSAAPARPNEASTSPGPLRGLPAFFLPGGADAGGGAQYQFRSGRLTAHFAASEYVLEAGGSRLSVRFLEARPQSRIEPLGPLPGRVNFLLGDRPENWRTDLPTYASLTYRSLYEGVDLVYSASGGGLKSEFRVDPGADPAAIRWNYPGVKRLRLERDGSLVATSAGGEIREERPLVYQEQDGRRTLVEGGFRILDDNSVGFWIGAYDHGRELVIDPVISYSTFLGGSGLDTIRALTVDTAGNAYVAGYTDSSDLPVAGSPAQAASRGGVEAFVAKLNSTGSSLVYCTYLGGSSDDRAFGIAVDSSGNAYLTGWTYSTNFPTTTGARQRTLGGGRDAFVSKLNPAGSALLYSTYLGGSGNDSGNGIAIDANGNAHVAGDTYSTNFPVLGGYRTSSAGRQDAFIAKLNSAGTNLVWSTYLGGSGDEGATALTVDSSGYVYVTGGTTSVNFPTYLALQAASGGGQDAFVTKLTANGQSLVFSTYLGGSGGKSGASETGTAIQRDAAGAVYVAGLTSSTDFPTVNAYQSSYRGGTVDGFVSKLDPSGSALVYSTYLGGSSADYIYGLAVGGSRAAAVAGYTSSSDFPLMDAVQTTKSGAYEGFVARLSPAGNALEIGSYLGGSDSESIYAIATDRGGNLWVAGQSSSLNFPVKNAFQTSPSGGYCGFVAKIADNIPIAGFRGSDGTLHLFTYTDSYMRNSGGYISSDVATSQLRNGDTYVVARNSVNAIWLNLFQNDTQSWKGWVYGGGVMAGNPAVAARADGGAYVVARDSGGSYWANRYQAGTGFLGWISLGGAFASDPAAAAASDGTLYIAGINAAGAVYTGRLTASGFLGWVSGGSPGSVAATGKPAITVGSDQAAYVAARTVDNTLWAARIQGDAWGAWSSGASNLRTDPSLASGSGVIYALLNTSTGPLAVRPFAEGASGGWQSPIAVGGYLSDGAIAASHNRFHIVGRDVTAAVWWYESGGATWTYYGYQGSVASELTIAPR
ncbi:MAG: SBBP repeat-containing protein [Bryobacteraceae bacterium]